MKTATINRLARKYLSIELLVLIFILYLFSVSCAEKKVSTVQEINLTRK